MSPRTVFLTVGTTKFDALVAAADSPEAADAMAARGYNKLVMQVGRGEYKPHRLLPGGGQKGRYKAAGGKQLEVEWFDFAPSLGNHMRSAGLVVSHAGSGSLFEALRLRVATVAVPNPALMDNHQAELAAQLAEDGYLLCATPEQLPAAIAALDPKKLKPYPAGNPADLARHIDGMMGFS